MPYSPTWQNPFLPQYNQGQPVMPMPYQQPVNGIVKVSGQRTLGVRAIDVPDHI